jgi:hypothetical protein
MPAGTNYPVLKVFTGNRKKSKGKLVVAFVAPKTGIVVVGSEGRYEIGDFSSKWAESKFSNLYTARMGNYPALKRYIGDKRESRGMLVYFSAPKKGVVVETGDSKYDVGYVSNKWVEVNYEAI